MNPVGLKFDGKVIDELSSTIPSNIFALNELTKNAYDAFSDTVLINIDTVNSQLIIEDDGLGMGESEVKKLFHIASSTKKYGSKKTHDGKTRYVQGSKGLGFLSVFKFGNRVTWESFYGGNKIEFTVDKNKLISKNNASRFKVTPTLIEEEGKGTKITVALEDGALDSLNNYFMEEKNTSKAVNAFFDPSFKIKLETLNGEYETRGFDDFLDEAIDKQFCKVSYSSVDSRLKFYREGKLVKESTFKVSSGLYSAELELLIYHLEGGRGKNISKLFYREPDDLLSPLLFINNNLFNNYVIFDSNINRSAKSGKSMPQMTGYVRVYSSHKEIEFNSDRTNFVESNLTNKILTDIAALNKKIQSIASELKDQDKENFGRVLTGRASPVSELEQNSEQDMPQVAKINLKNSLPKRFQIPSSQLDLLTFISTVSDSSGRLVSNSEIKIEIDGEEASPIIPSTNEECIKKVDYKYYDNQTGEVIERLNLNFFTPRGLVFGAEKSKKQLFTLASNKSYNVRIPVVAQLINQSSELYKSKVDYSEIIACGLRTIFELSIDELKSKYPKIFEHNKANSTKYKKSSSLTWDTVQVIHFITSHIDLLRIISESIGLGFHSLKNLIDFEGYVVSTNKAQLGAHKSIKCLSPDDLKSLAQRAGHFAIFCDVLIYKIPESKITSFNHIQIP